MLSEHRSVEILPRPTLERTSRIERHYMCLSIRRDDGVAKTRDHLDHGTPDSLRSGIVTTLLSFSAHVALPPSTGYDRATKLHGRRGRSCRSFENAPGSLSAPLQPAPHKRLAGLVIVRSTSLPQRSDSAPSS